MPWPRKVVKVNVKMLPQSGQHEEDSIGKIKSCAPKVSPFAYVLHDHTSPITLMLFVYHHPAFWTPF